MCVFSIFIALMHQSWAKTVESFSTLDRHWHAEGWDACLPPRHISGVLGHDVGGSALWPSRPGKGEYCCSFNQKKGAVLIHIQFWGLTHKEFKMTQTLGEGSMTWVAPDGSPKGSHLQSYVASSLWCHCLNNLPTGTYWHELSTRLQYTVNSELFLLLKRGFFRVLICLFYGF